MSTKNLLLVISTLEKGGSERVLSILANGFVEKGYKVTIALLRSDKVCYTLNSQIQVVSLYRPFRSFSIAERVKRSVQVLWDVRKWSRLHKYDAIISFGQNTNIKVLLGNIFLNNKIIVSDRNDPKFASTRAEVFFRNIIYRLAAHIVVQTHQIRKEQYQHFKNVQVIYNPLMEHNIMAELKNKTIVTVGRLDAAKNHQFLITSLKDVLPTGWEFHIIGDGPARKSLQQLIEQHNAADGIKLLGRIDNVYEHIATASLFVYASKSEGYPNAVIEAMSVGLPVVSGNCKYGLAEIIEDNTNGFLINLSEPEIFRQKVTALINDASLRKRIGTAAINIKEKTNRNNIISKWLNLIQ